MSDTAIKKLEGTKYTGIGVLAGPNTFVDGIPFGFGVRYQADDSIYFELSGEIQGVIGHPYHHSQRGVVGLMGADAKVYGKNLYNGLEVGIGPSLRYSGQQLIASMASLEVRVNAEGNYVGFQLGLGSVKDPESGFEYTGVEMRALFHF